jgi:phosphoglycolate phosphatase
MSSAWNPPDAVIFDFDGVVVQSVEIKAQAFAEVYRNEDPAVHPAIMEYQHRHGGISRRKKFEYFEREFFGRTPTPETIEELSRQFTGIVHDAVVACPFVDGALQALEQLHSRVPLYLVSGTPEDELLAIVHTRQLGRFFKIVRGAPTTKIEAFKAITSCASFTASRVVTVGDSLTEFEAACELGLRFVAIVPPKEISRFPASVAHLPNLVGLCDLLLPKEAAR